MSISDLKTRQKSSADKLLFDKSPSEYKRSKKYVPDLAGFISLCETNYAKLMKLLVAFDADERVFGLSRADSQFGWIKITITERCKFTTTLQFRQFFESSTFESVASEGERENVWLNEPVMQVRLYHDAGMVEVLSFQSNPQLKPSYIYPNSKMYQKDEKAQCNRFLSDWLSYCLTYGQVDDFEFAESELKLNLLSGTQDSLS